MKEKIGGKNKEQSIVLILSFLFIILLIILFFRYTLFILNGALEKPTKLLDLFSNFGFMLFNGIFLSVGILNFISVFRSKPSRKSLLFYGIQFIFCIVLSIGFIVYRLDIYAIFILLVTVSLSGFVYFEEIKWYKKIRSIKS